MKLIDISMEISGDMPVYKGRSAKRPIITLDSDFSDGGVYESRLEMNLHTGTHFDAPLHMIPGGDTTGSIMLEQTVRKCKVLDFSRAEDKIARSDLASKDIQPGDFVLLKTKNSELGILEGNFIYLDTTGAVYLRERGVVGVGIDALGIEHSQPGHETHKILLSAGILILEGLRLKSVDEGEYYLIAAPIKIAGAEAAPVRAFVAGTEGFFAKNQT